MRVRVSYGLHCYAAPQSRLTARRLTKGLHVHVWEQLARWQYRYVRLRGLLLLECRGAFSLHMLALRCPVIVTQDIFFTPGLVDL